MNASLSHALAWAGLLEQGLAANDVALQGIASIDKLDRDFFGFDIKQWVLGIRIRLLVRMGRLHEASLCLRSLDDSVESRHDPVIRQLTYLLHTEIAWSSSDVDQARAQCAKVARIAREHGSAYSKVLDFWTSALAELTAADFDEAARSCVQALDLIRSARVGAECEAEILAILAESRYRAGNLPQALADAVAAAALSSERSNRVTRARALIVHGGVLARDTAQEAQAQALFAEAQSLIAESGARLLEASLARERQWLTTA